MMTLLAAGPASAGWYTGTFVSNDTDGVRVSCANPDRVLGVVRTEAAATVFQAGPDGIRWQVALPPAPGEFDYVRFAPDGSAVVVGPSKWSDTSRSFLVSDGGEPTEIDGPVSIVDFQKGRVLIATHVLDANEDGGTRVRVYAIESGELLGDSTFDDELAFTVTHDADKQFNLRLAEDGRTYYYIRWTRSAEDELVVRQTATGRLHAIHDNHPAPVPVVNNTIANLGIHDALLYSDRGYVIAAGELFALKDQELVVIETPDALGWPVRLVESDNALRQVVVGSKAWGVLDAGTGQWDIVERNGYAYLQSGAAGVTVVDLSRRTSGIRTWDVSGADPELVRDSGVDKPSRTPLLCANAYGFMTYRNGEFDWHPTVKQP